MPGNLLGYLNFTSLIILLVAAGLGVFLFGRLSASLRVLVINIWITFGLGLAATLLWLQSFTNLPILHIYTVAEFCLLGMFFALLAPPKDSTRNVITIVVVAGAVLMLLNTLFLQEILQFNSNARTLEAILLAGMGVYYLFLLSGPNSHLEASEGKAFSVINAGIILYFSASLLIFLTSAFTGSMSKEMSRNIWVIHALLNILYNVLLCAGLIAFWKTSLTSSD